MAPPRGPCSRHIPHIPAEAGARAGAGAGAWVWARAGAGAGAWARAGSACYPKPPFTRPWGFTMGCGCPVSLMGSAPPV